MYYVHIRVYSYRRHHLPRPLGKPVAPALRLVDQRFVAADALETLIPLTIAVEQRQALRVCVMSVEKRAIFLGGGVQGLAPVRQSHGPITTAARENRVRPEPLVLLGGSAAGAQVGYGEPCGRAGGSGGGGQPRAEPRGAPLRVRLAGRE